MSSLKQTTRSATRPQAHLAQHSAALAQLARERERAHAEADQAMQGIADLLPRAIEAGMSVVDAARITGLSRPTLYRMLSEGRKRRPLRDVAAHFERALEANGRASPAELASRFGVPTEQVFEALLRLYPVLADDFAALGPPALTDLVKLLPELVAPESIVLAMLFLHRQTTEHVAASTQLSSSEVLGWAALGLLRVLARITAAQESAGAGALETKGWRAPHAGTTEVTERAGFEPAME